MKNDFDCEFNYIFKIKQTAEIELCGSNRQPYPCAQIALGFRSSFLSFLTKYMLVHSNHLLQGIEQLK